MNTVREAAVRVMPPATDAPANGMTVGFNPDSSLDRSCFVGARFIGRLTVNNRPINRAPTTAFPANGFSGFKEAAV
jgi:hypothetical protein